MNNVVTSCIVLYKNDRDVLLRAINSFLLSEGDFEKHLFLVDNSPTDSLRNIVDFHNVTYIFNPSNPGFGAAHNIAIKKSMAKGSKYHLVLNPDVYFDSKVICELVKYMDSGNKIGNVMPKVLYPDGELQFLCKLLPTPFDWIGRRFNPFKSMFKKRNEKFELRFTNYNKIMEVPYLSGCFMFLNVAALKKTGLFDEKIFMYGEETDLCRRLNDCGYKTIFYPKVQIYHHFAKGSHKSWRLTKIGIKSAMYYFNKWGWFFDKKRQKINQETLNKLLQ